MVHEFLHVILPAVWRSYEGWGKRVQNSPRGLNSCWSDRNFGYRTHSSPPRHVHGGACRRLSETGKELTICSR
ncbi:hypothetical protein XELAEV_18002701mg [Xenopus laevis]|nr:hypothetical protein XELAEV_18002701mg [Xenopus laevis]